MIVHILHQGVSICDFSCPNGVFRVPGEWPPGHVWVSVDDRKDANCDECLELSSPERCGERCFCNLLCVLGKHEGKCRCIGGGKS